MSGRRSRISNATEEEINDLVVKLQSLLPQYNQRRNGTFWKKLKPDNLDLIERVAGCAEFENLQTLSQSAANVLAETCTYLKRLRTEVDDLSERLAQLLESVDTTAVDVELIRRLLR